LSQFFEDSAWVKRASGGPLVAKLSRRDRSANPEEQSMKTKPVRCLNFRIPVGLVCLAAIANGCGGSTNDGGGTEPVVIDDFAGRFAAAFCDNIEPCCQQQGFKYDAVTCKTAFSQFLDTELIAKAKAGGVSYDAEAAGQCLSAFAKAATACQPDELPAVCDRIFIGTKPVGAACDGSLECAPPADGGRGQCEEDQNGQAVCVQEPRGKAGDACNQTCNDHGSGIDCEGFGPADGSATCWRNDGLYCDPTGGHCAVLISIGQACDQTGCVNGAYCDNGTCAAKLAAGGDCSSSSEACADGFYCDPSSKCQPQKAAGEACTEGEECTSYCNESGVCEPQGLLTEDACAGITS
jgi:hypothetical protein